MHISTIHVLYKKNPLWSYFGHGHPEAWLVSEPSHIFSFFPSARPYSAIQTSTVHAMTTGFTYHHQWAPKCCKKMSHRLAVASFLALLAGQRAWARTTSDVNCDAGTAEEECIAADDDNGVSTGDTHEDSCCTGRDGTLRDDACTSRGKEVALRMHQMGEVVIHLEPRSCVCTSYISGAAAVLLLLGSIQLGVVSRCSAATQAVQ